MALMELRNISCRYPGEETPALEDISLRLESGEILLVLGASASGKSSFCRLVCGLMHHFYRAHVDGELSLCGLDPSRASLDGCVRRAGMVFQRPENQLTGTRFTVAEEVAVGPENLGLDRPAIQRRVDQALDMVGIPHLAGRNPMSLSGGERQRTALATVLAMEPQLVVLDEPASQLDPQGEHQVLTIVRKLADRGCGIVMTASDAGHAANLADRILVLREGRPALFGAPAQVLASKQLAETGVPAPVWMDLARRAMREGLWPREKAFPLSMDEAAQGFREVLRHAD
ncbi:energy-coupling factor ABC transporter ATP-binding protein [Salidesulfovibrio onnuriiensis]|uniref:energy-coupling factor ABC transporter ATP-binding protein n=1 Tax=Salidesulfovibrio onnuriiensis TaxID=2583823 RepID=UPI0011C75D03|nr:ABC transporter ATP-binding protein [Salidesulfovibrio onnuriiensis]